MFSGATDWDEVGRKTGALPRSENTIWRPMRLKALVDVKVVAVSSSSCSVHMFAVTDEGHVYGWGRNEKGQLGIGDAKDRKCPTLVKELTGHKVVSVATGRNHSLFLTGTNAKKSVLLNFSLTFNTSKFISDSLFFKLQMKEKYLLVEITARVNQLAEGVLPQILRQNRSNMTAQTL